MTPEPPAVNDAVEVPRRRAVRCMVRGLVAVVVSYAVLALVVVLDVPVVGVVTLAAGFIAQVSYGMLAVHLGATARRAAADGPAPRGALAAIVVGLLLVIAAVVLWLYTTLALVIIIGMQR